jgi:hypothetical protein
MWMVCLAGTKWIQIAEDMVIVYVFLKGDVLCKWVHYTLSNAQFAAYFSLLIELLILRMI